MRVLGAQPVMMPSEQLPMAITEHVIDACLDPWHLVPPFRLNDVLRLHTEFADVSPNVTTHVLAMNRAGYDRLPRDLKIVIDNNSGQAAAAMAGAMWDNQATAIVNMAVERGDLIVTLLPDAVARWRKAVEPVLDIWRKELKERKIDGGKLINAAHASLAKYANEPEPSASQTPSPSQQVTSQPPQSAPTGGQKPNVAPSATPASASTASPATPAPQPPPGRITSPAPTMPTSPPAAAASPSSASAAPPVKPVAPAASAPAPASASAPSSAQMSAPAATASPAVAPPPPASPTTPAPSVATAPAAPSPVPKPVPKALDIRL
jgi:hypothetical protein